jgi:hypothetical protein
MPARHGFVQVPDGRRIEERHLRAEDSTHGVGHIEQAPYMNVVRPSWWTRAAARVTRRAVFEEAWLLRTFDTTGGDALGLLAAPPLDLGPDEDRTEAPRRVAGRVARLEPGPSAVVLDDAWFDTDAETWRVAEGVDFVIERGRNDAVVVSFGLAPLVVACPEPVERVPFLDSLTAETRRMIPADRTTGGTGDRLRISIGDDVEVWGVCRGLSDSRRTFSLGGDYRTAPRPARVVGDEDGTRLVIVRTGG